MTLMYNSNIGSNTVSDLSATINDSYEISHKHLAQTILTHDMWRTFTCTFTVPENAAAPWNTNEEKAKWTDELAVTGSQQHASGQRTVLTFTIQTTTLDHVITNAHTHTTEHKMHKNQQHPYTDGSKYSPSIDSTFWIVNRDAVFAAKHQF